MNGLMNTTPRLGQPHLARTIPIETNGEIKQCPIIIMATASLFRYIPTLGVKKVHDVLITASNFEASDTIVDKENKIASIAQEMTRGDVDHVIQLDKEEVNILESKVAGILNEAVSKIQNNLENAEKKYQEGKIGWDTLEQAKKLTVEEIAGKLSLPLFFELVKTYSGGNVQ